MLSILPARRVGTISINLGQHILPAFMLFCIWEKNKAYDEAYSFSFSSESLFFCALSGHQKAEYLTGAVFHHDNKPLLSWDEALFLTSAHLCCRDKKRRTLILRRLKYWWRWRLAVRRWFVFAVCLKNGRRFSSSLLRFAAFRWRVLVCKRSGSIGRWERVELTIKFESKRFSKRIYNFASA